ncbi:MAG: phosphate signaling complex protein PhoU [Planctomycetes bacterium]|jgi:phosphate transport system protein|nr:phosphate signaling complex protein PhoU [Planctomycetota bacterium]MCP4838268.1 phosphate signaling complex protein PhoU [Planctomycetota bacterium]
MDDFHKSLESVLNDLLSQGRRVTDISLAAVESYFENNAGVAAGVIREDATIDHVDVQIERSCIALMGYRPSDEHDQRSILTIVKINNELERIADCAVNIAQATEQRKDTEVADTLRVMANSVVGMVRDTVEALRSRDTNLAQRVLSFDDTVDAFKDELVTRAQNALAGGVVSVGAAMQLLSVVRAVERMADHCTNICEQVIYLETGKIVRHLPSGWTAPTLPEDA